MTKHSAKLMITGLACSLLLAGCKQPEIQGQPNQQGLAQVQYSGMNAALANPAVDFAKYKAIVIDDMDFSQVQISEPTDYSGRYAKFKLTDEDRSRLNDGYKRKLAESLSENGGYRIVDSAAAGATATLRIRTELLRLQPNAPRERDEIGAGSARDKTFTKGAGSMTLASALIDAGNGKVVAAFRDELTDTEVWDQNNAVTNRAAILRAFDSWGRALRRQLEAFSTPKP